MEYDSLRTDRDDIVRDGADFEAYRRPGVLIDSEHPKIAAHAKQIAAEGGEHAVIGNIGKDYMPDRKGILYPK